ncbi:MAG: protein kinase [Candidatus Krumholzibacteria bacterium]|nr:protein kinase [Candidatus Krumholzibacteria bacterium]
MIGKTISYYKIVSKLGEGGMGVVYKAEDTRLDRSVALKFLPSSLATNDAAKKRFIREAKAASSLEHPNICAVYDIAETDDGQMFIAMPHYGGASLQEKIAKGPLEIGEVTDIVLQLASGLAKAHEQGIVHRDVKPGNIFVTKDGHVKILDFGLAKLATQARLTKSGTSVGTAAYMSPEQVRGGEVDHRSDIWSFGIVLFEIVSGQLPFKGDHEQAVMYSIVNEEPKPLTGMRTGVRVELERIVSKCLAKDPGERYQTATDLLADLRHLQRITTTQVPLTRSASSQTGVGRLVRHWPWMAALVLVAALTVFVQRRSVHRDATPEITATGAHVDEGAGQVSSSGPSIAVLPFTNASGDPDQEYFSDGLTEDIITELSRFRELSVFARNSTAHYKGKDVDIREIGALLGARYVLQGSVRKAGQRIRISVQLSESGDGRSVWGTNYERNLTARGLFELQDELTQQVVNAIAGSYGALTRAWLAYLYAEQYHHRWNERTGEFDALDQALQIAEEAVRLDPVNYVAHGALALTHFLRGDPERGKIEAYRTIDLNPNNALWLALLGYYLSLQGDFEHSVPMMRKVIALNPHPPPWIRNTIFLDHYAHGRYEAALAEANRMELGDFRNPLFLAAAYGQLDRPDDARQALEELRALWSLPVSELRRELIERHAFSAALAGHLMEGLAKAGMEGVADPTTPGSSLVD